MKERLPRLTTDMLAVHMKPDSRTSYNKLLSIAFGEIGDDLRERVTSGASNVFGIVKYGDQLRENFFGFFKQAFGVPDTLPVELAYKRVNETVVDLVEGCFETVFPNFRDDPFRNETKLGQSDPFAKFRDLIASSSGSRPEHAARLQFVLSLLDAYGEASFDSIKADKTQREYNDLLDEKFYSSPQNRRLRIYSFHDPDTNEVRAIKFRNPGKTRVDGSVLFADTIDVRKVGGLGIVQTSVYPYDPVETLEKIITKSIDCGNGVLDPNSVSREMVYKVVVYRPKDLTQPLIGSNKTSRTTIDGLEVMGQRLTEIVCTDRPISEIKPEHEMDSSSANGEIEQKRYRIYEDGQPANVQFTVVSLEGDLNRHLHVGKKNLRGIYDGQARGLFKLRRIISVIEATELGKSSGLNVWVEGAKRSDEIAARLKTPTLLL